MSCLGFLCPHCLAMFITREEMIGHVRSSHQPAAYSPVSSAQPRCTRRNTQRLALGKCAAARGSVSAPRAPKSTQQVPDKTCGTRDAPSKIMMGAVQARGQRSKLVCPLCPYTTELKQHLARHERTHTGVRPHQCLFCDKTFSQSSSLNTHTNGVHLRAYTFSCAQCDYATSHKGNLTVHMRRHTQDRPYRCGDCDFATSQRSALLNHTARHTGTKNRLCWFCGFSCITSTQLKSHVSNNHGPGKVPAHQCATCKAAFVSRRGLNMHLSRSHREQALEQL